jgi:ketosteroid isomerase-like protein
MTYSNRELVQHMTEAFLKGDVATVQDCLAQNIIWYFPGRSKLAGVFHGREAVLKHLIQPPQPGVSMKLTPRAFFGDEQYGAALYEITSRLNGKTLTETRVMVCKMDNEEIVETRIYP